MIGPRRPRWSFRRADTRADNRHRGADQWLFVVSGVGQAIVNGKRYPLRAGSLVLIEGGDRHEIPCTARADLKTESIYLPPAYSQDGKELARARANRP